MNRCERKAQLESSKCHHLALQQCRCRYMSTCPRTVVHMFHCAHVLLCPHSIILRQEEAPVCVACNAIITVKHVLIECADLLEIRKKYFEEKSLYSLFRNVIPEIIFDFLREICVFYKI